MNKNKQNNTALENQRLPQRKTIRLQGYDYSQAGLYFITICTQNRKYLFGDVVDGNATVGANLYY